MKKITLKQFFYIPNYLGFIIFLLFFGFQAESSENQEKSSAHNPFFSQPEGAKVKRQVTLMTVPVEFIIFTENKPAANTAIDSAISEIKRIETLMSEWQPESLVSKINNLAGIEPVEVGEELFRLLLAAKEIAKLTDGKFDITFASAGKFWDFRKQLIPSSKKIEQAIKIINYQKLILNHQEKSVFLSKSGMRIGLGGIAKGYTVDRSAQIFRDAGFEAFSINAGGDLYAAGSHQKASWKIGIQDPRKRQEIIALLPVANTAVATSGDYERFFIADGKRYHHIIDPDTGYPADRCQSVTILAPKAFLADALATGVFVLGPAAGLKLVETLPEIEALIVDAKGKIHHSSGIVIK